MLMVILVGSLSACAGATPTQPKSSLEGTISISGAFALFPMMQKWAEEFQKVNPGVTFDISAGGAGKGMADVLSGAIDIGEVIECGPAREVFKHPQQERTRAYLEGQF